MTRRKWQASRQRIRMKIDYRKLAAVIVITLTAAAIGSVATFQSIPTWYATLNKPALNPPSWVFGPVWTILYVLMAVSAYLVWNSKSRQKREALAIYGLQLILNVAWSIAFFGFKSPFYALVVIIALWLTIAATIVKFNKISKRAAWLLIPYIAWVTFAAYLNYSVLVLNP